MPSASSSSTKEVPAADGNGGRRLHTVHVRFAPAQGRRLRAPTTFWPGDALWTERPLLMERADGSYDLIGTTARLDGLVRWLLSHGTDATIEAPARLRRRVAAEARRILRKYGSEPLNPDSASDASDEK